MKYTKILQVVHPNLSEWILKDLDIKKHYKSIKFRKHFSNDMLETLELALRNKQSYTLVMPHFGKNWFKRQYQIEIWLGEDNVLRCILRSQKKGYYRYYYVINKEVAILIKREKGYYFRTRMKLLEGKQ